MRMLKLALIAIIIMSCSSCVTSFSEKVSLESCDKVEMIGFTGLKATFGFRNESSSTITLKHVTMTLRRGDTAIGSIELKEEVKIPRRSSFVEVPTIWKLYDVNLLALISASSKLSSGKTDGFRVDVVAEVKTGLLKRTYEFNDLSLSDIKAELK